MQKIPRAVKSGIKIMSPEAAKAAKEYKFQPSPTSPSSREPSPKTCRLKLRV
jgi:hypothetical protein